MNKGALMLICMTLMTAILVILKCYGIISVPWLWVFSPFWIVGCEGVIMAIIEGFIGKKKE